MDVYAHILETHPEMTEKERVNIYDRMDHTTKESADLDAKNKLHNVSIIKIAFESSPLIYTFYKIYKAFSFKQDETKQLEQKN